MFIIKNHKMTEKYTKEEVQLAINMCKKYTVEVKTPPPAIDGMLDCEIETIEWKYFLHNLEQVHNKL